MLLRRRDALVLGSVGVASVAVLRRIFAAPVAPAMRFVAVGDWGRQGHDEQRAVGAAMGRAAEIHRSTWTLSMGDNFYEDGVQGLDDPQWRSSFEDIYDAPSLRSPWRVILGNHDYRGDVQAQLDYGTRDARWSMPARYYATSERLADGTRCDLFFIDTNPFLSRYRYSKVHVDGQDPVAQLAWLERGLAASQADWKIVIGHHPIHTVDGAPTEEPELIATLKPVLERHGVRLYSMAISTTCSISGWGGRLRHQRRRLEADPPLPGPFRRLGGADARLHDRHPFIRRLRVRVQRQCRRAAVFGIDRPRRLRPA